MTGAPPYAAVDLTGLQPPIPGRPLRPEEFQDLKPRLRPFIPPHFPILHGQGLGPKIAEAAGKLGELILVPGDGFSCMPTEKLQELVAAGLTGLIGVPVVFKRQPKGQKGISVVELAVQGLVNAASPSQPPGGVRLCGICGRNNIHERKRGVWTVKRSSIPRSGDVFAFAEFNCTFVFTDRFAQVAAKVFASADFEEIPVIDE